MAYLIFKSLHIIFIVTWFAGLFYVGRLFVYLKEAESKSKEERRILVHQLSLMTHRLWYFITWPSAILTLLFASLLLFYQPEWLKMTFMHIKLTWVLILYAYHFSCHIIYKKLILGKFTWTTQHLRMWNEIPTIILISITFLIVLKNSIDWLLGVLLVIILVFLLYISIKLYKIVRKN